MRTRLGWWGGREIPYTLDTTCAHKKTGLGGSSGKHWQTV